MACVLAARGLDELEEGGVFLLAVDYESAVEYFVAAMLGVDLREAEHLAVGQGAAEALGELLEVLFLIGAQGEAFALVVGCYIGYFLGCGGAEVGDEHVGAGIGVEGLEHGVDCRRRGDGSQGFNARNAVESHVLGNLHGICAPRTYHFATRTGVGSGEAYVVGLGFSS